MLVTDLVEGSAVRLLDRLGHAEGRHLDELNSLGLDVCLLFLDSAGKVGTAGQWAGGGSLAALGARGALSRGQLLPATVGLAVAALDIVALEQSAVLAAGSLVDHDLQLAADPADVAVERLHATWDVGVGDSQRGELGDVLGEESVGVTPLKNKQKNFRIFGSYLDLSITGVLIWHGAVGVVGVQPERGV